MTKCKTKSDLHREYARVLDMCEGTDVKPWECAKNLIVNCQLEEPPTFPSKVESYQFALCLVDNKPVFEGDELWFNKNKFTVKSIDNGCLMLSPGKELPCLFLLLDNVCLLSWQPPQPAEPYAPFREALANGKWVQVQSVNNTWVDLNIKCGLYGALLGENNCNIPHHPTQLRIVDKVASWHTSLGNDTPLIKVTYNRETREVNAEVMK